MNKNELAKGFDRLNGAFKFAYTQEHLRLIGNEVRGFQGYQWERIVDDLIRNFRIAPTIKEICNTLSLERERVHKENKKDYAREAEDFWNPKTSDEEVKWRFSVMKRRLLGQCDDAEWELFMDKMAALAKGEKSKPVEIKKVEEKSMYARIGDALNGK